MCLLFSLSLFFLWEVELEISFSTYFFKHAVGLTPFKLKKIQKMKRHDLGKNLDVFQLNSTFFIQILMIILNIIGHAVFPLLFE